VYAMALSDQKRWSQDPCPPRPHLRVGSGGESILLGIRVYLWPSEGKYLFFSLLLHLCLLCLGLSLFFTAEDFATPLLLLYFPSSYSITP